MITHETPVRSVLADAIATEVGNAGKIKIYQGDLATLLATFTGDSPTFGAAVSGVITLADVSNVTASATGTAQTFSVTDSGDVVIFKGTVGIAGSGADLILNTTSIVSGGTVSINSLTYAAPV